MKYFMAQFHPLPQLSYCWMTEWLIASRRAWSVATPWKETELRSFWSTTRFEPPAFWRLHTVFTRQYSFILGRWKWLVFTWFGQLHARMFRFWAQSHPSLLCLLWILHFMFEKRQDNSLIPKKNAAPNLPRWNEEQSPLDKSPRFIGFKGAPVIRNIRVVSKPSAESQPDQFASALPRERFVDNGCGWCCILTCFKAIKRISKMVIYAWWTVVNSTLL